MCKKRAHFPRAAEAVVVMDVLQVLDFALGEMIAEVKRVQGGSF